MARTVRPPLIIVGLAGIGPTACQQQRRRPPFLSQPDGAFRSRMFMSTATTSASTSVGFAAFVFDATPYSTSNVGDNVIAVKVNNAANADIEPSNADFTFWGGIYRDVHLLVTDPVQISPLDYVAPAFI